MKFLSNIDGAILPIHLLLNFQPSKACPGIHLNSSTVLSNLSNARWHYAKRWPYYCSCKITPCISWNCSLNPFTLSRNPKERGILTSLPDSPLPQSSYHSKLAIDVTLGTFHPIEFCWTLLDSTSPNLEVPNGQLVSTWSQSFQYISQFEMNSNHIVNLRIKPIVQTSNMWYLQNTGDRNVDKSTFCDLTHNLTGKIESIVTENVCHVTNMSFWIKRRRFIVLYLIPIYVLNIVILIKHGYSWWGLCNRACR